MRYPTFKHVIVIIIFLVLGDIYESNALNSEKTKIAPQRIDCEVMATEKWSSNERWAWEKICVGEVADFNTKLKRNLDPSDQDFKSKNRYISASFIETIIFNKQYAKAITNRGVRLNGIWVKEDINLSDASIEHGMWIDNSLLEKGIDLDNAASSKYITLNGTFVKGIVNMNSASINGRLSLSRGKFMSKLVLSRISVNGDLELNNAHLKEASLNSSKINGNLIFDNTQIMEDFNVVGASIEGTVYINNSQLNGKVDFTDSNMETFAIIGGTTWSDKLNMLGLTIRGNFEISGNNSFKGPVTISSSKVSKHMAIGDTETVFEDELSMSFIEVLGEFLDMSGGKYKGIVRLPGSHIAGDLNIFGATFEKKLIITQSKIDRNMGMSETTVNDSTSVARSKIFGTLAMNNAHFGKEVDMQSIHVGQHIKMVESIFMEAVDFSHMQLSGSMLLSGSHFFLPLNLTNSQIGGALWLWREGENNPIWENKSDKPLGPMLNLRSAKVKIVDDHPNSWPEKIDITNFVYEQFGNFEGDRGGGKFRNTFPEWYVEWVEKGQSEDGIYVSQPYIQASETLKTMGKDRAKRMVIYAAGERKRKSPETGLLEKVWLLLVKIFTGYGQELWRAVIAIAIFTILGAVFLRLSKEGPRNNMPYGLSYSFDRVIPLVKIDDRFEKIIIKTKIRYWFYFQRIMGYVLATLIISSILGTIR